MLLQCSQNVAKIPLLATFRQPLVLITRGFLRLQRYTLYQLKIVRRSLVGSKKGLSRIFQFTLREKYQIYVFSSKIFYSSVLRRSGLFQERKDEYLYSRDWILSIFTFDFLALRAMVSSTQVYV